MSGESEIKGCIKVFCYGAGAPKKQDIFSKNVRSDNFGDVKMLKGDGKTPVLEKTTLFFINLNRC